MGDRENGATGKSDIALIGLAVMGQNLVMNMADHGFAVTAYNRTAARTAEFLDGPARGMSIRGADTLEALVESLSVPRKIMLMVQAGRAVDAVIEDLVPLLEPGDLIVDGGNSNFVDTERRAKALGEKGLLFVGTGVSGGEEGARHGPSMMPGGHAEAWPLVKDIFQGIAAKTDAGVPCCDWVGDGGAGHFVKMVHNGIEYGDMQLIAEVYHFMGERLGMDNDAMAETFARWNAGELDSYLVEITAAILAYRTADGEATVDRILDKAGQKGTGKWTGINALELGIPLTLIAEAVFARALSARKDERVRACRVLEGPGDRRRAKDPDGAHAGDEPGAPDRIDDAHRGEWVEALADALFAAKIVSYAQGYMLMREAANEYGWTLNYGGIAQMWRGGCIIRAAFLDDIKAAFEKDPELDNLLLDDFFRDKVHGAQANWRRVIAEAVTHGLPMPASAAGLAFFDGYRSARLPANLVQAQRDYFGAHTWQDVDGSPEWHHTDWTGRGGAVSSTSYDA